MGPTRRSRRAFAACATLLWLLGVEVLPNVHLAAHRGDHTHAADGTILTSDHRHRGPDRDDHTHQGDLGDRDHHAHHAGAAGDRDGHAHHGVATGEHARHHEPQLAIDHDDPIGHVASGLAHHATALHAPPPPIITPLGAPLAARWRHPAPNAPLLTIVTARPAARGPPVG